jgi:REP-associated tyrosine transposase
MSNPYGGLVPRRHRPEIPGGFFHITARGVRQAPLLLDRLDYEAWLRVLARTVERFEWRCHAYCAMPNHFHLLLETPGPTRSAGMRHLNGSLAQRFNERYDGSGHVFQGRYGARTITREAHFGEVPRYIVLNPVRAGLCRRPEEWPWSSYWATAGLSPKPSFLTLETILGTFADGIPEAQRRYRAHVAAGLVSARHGIGPGPEGAERAQRNEDQRSTRRTWLRPGPSPT